MAESRVTILVAHYNNGKYFRDCWESIKGQSSDRWNVVIVDDCSTDDSLDIIKSLTDDDDRVQIYMNEENRGVAYTKDQCAKLATTDLAGFLDPDDVLEPKAVELMLKAFDENPGIVLAYSKMIYVDKDLVEYNRTDSKKVVDTEDPNFFNLQHLITHFTVFKTAVYKDTGGIDTYIKRAVDQDMYLKLCEKGPSYFVDEYLIRYRMHGAGVATGDGGNNTKRAYYWFWFVINAAAKRRGVYVEDLFIEKLVSASLLKKDQKIVNSLSYRIAAKLTRFKK